MQIGVGGKEEVLKPKRENKRGNEPIKLYEVQRLTESGCLREKEGLFSFKHPRQKQILASQQSLTGLSGRKRQRNRVFHMDNKKQTLKNERNTT